MIKNILFGILLSISLSGMSQIVFFSEDFEGSTLSMTSDTSGLNSWATSSTLYSQGVKSDTCSLDVNDTIRLTSNTFSTIGSSVVYLGFDQICKIEYFDTAVVEVSTDNGMTWSRLNSSEYLGNGILYNSGFNEASYISDWGGASIATPTNQWWKYEKFNISMIAANKAQVKVRFVLIDGNGTGSSGRYGWLIDDVKVWKPNGIDANASEFILPYTLASGCGLGNETVQLKIVNSGDSLINGNLTASFQREGLSVNTESVNTAILPNDTFLFTFSNTVDLSTTIDTAYELKVWVNLTGDLILVNDTTSRIIASRVGLTPPIASDTTIAYGNSVVLQAVHNDTVTWFSDPLGDNVLNYGQVFNTPILYDTAYYYAQAGAVARDSILTTFVGGSTARGNMFDIQAINTITIDSFDVNGSTNALMEVWYRSGSYVGHNTSSIGWTKLGSYAVNYAIAGKSTSLPIGGLTIPGGQTYGICITYVTSGNINTTVGNGANQTQQDANMKIIHGSSGSYFNYSSTPRVWNGKVFYHSGGIGAVGSCSSPMTKVTVKISGIPVTDAGLSTISPTGTLGQGTVAPIKVTLKNSGLDTLKKCDLYYSINDSIYPSIPWTGTLSKGDTALLTLTNFTFNYGVYRIKAWTSQPNDSADIANQNDTLSSLVSVCLSGSLTLGSPTADFASFASLNNLLSTVGVCGNTVINILPGVYNEQIAFGQVTGASSTSTLTLQSASGNPADVTIKYGAINSGDDYVIKINGSSYITLRKITVKAIGTAYASGVSITNGAHHIVLDSNIIISELLSSGTGRAISSTGGSVCHNVTISNNQIVGGYYGIYIYRYDTDLANGLIVEGNDIIDFNYTGAHIYNQRQSLIKNNRFRNNPLSAAVTGIYLRYNDGCKILANDILINGSAFQVGMRMYNCDSLNGVRGLCANNMIITGVSSSSHYGIYHYLSNGMDIINNSLYNENGGTNNAIIRLYTLSSQQGNAIYNNSIHNTGPGYNIYVSNSSRVKGADYNNIYGPNATYFAYWGGNYSSLAALKSAFPNRNQNSISVNPQYLSNIDLHSISVPMDSAGTPFTSLVPTDIDGDIRDSLTPDIGADEYDLFTDDVSVYALVSPLNSCSGDSADVIISLKSLGIDTLFNCVVNWMVDSVVKSSAVFSGGLVYGQSANLLLGSHVFTSGSTHTIKVWSSLPNGQMDLNKTNDTLLMPFNTSITAGVYTVGGSGADYPSLSAVAADLNNNGICGPVVFNIASGTYNEQVSLGSIYGASAINTITFQSASGDSSDVIISYNVLDVNSNYIIQLNGTRYLRIKDISLIATSSSLSNVISMKNRVSDFELMNCVIKNTTQNLGTISLNARNLVHTNDSIGDNIAFRNNDFINGNIGLYLNGGASPKIGWVISNNKFSSNAKSSISMISSMSPIIKENEINNNTIVISSYHAIEINYSRGSIQITKNKVALTGSATCQAISLFNNYGDTISPILIANNFVSLNQLSASTWASGIQANATKNINIYHNNVVIYGNHSNSSPLQVNNASAGQTENLNIKNNIFVNFVVGGSIYQFTNCGYGDFTNDYNVLFNGQLGNIVNGITTLSAWQAASSGAMNSIMLNPYFSSYTDLHVSNNLLNGAAISLPQILDDIDGDVRNATNPDMGADEFEPSPYDVSVSEIISPMSACDLDSNESISILIKNIGSADIENGLSVAYNYPGLSSPIIESINDTLFSGDSLVYVFNAKVNMDVMAYGSDSTFQMKSWSMLTIDLAKYNDTAYANISSYFMPSSPSVIATTSSNYGQSSSLSATSASSIAWYASNSSTNSVGTGSTFQTPLLYDTTQYWVSSFNSNCESPRVVTQVNVTYYPLIDAGIEKIISPNSNLTYNTSQILQVELHNYGLSALTSATVFWTINGQLDSLLWTGNLAHNEKDTVNLDTTGFAGGSYDFQSWSSIPNMVSDTVNTNDSSSVFTFNVCLSGSYTIGHASSGMTYDFASYNIAMTELVAGGMCGPVTFMVDSGYYEEMVSFPPISGAGPNARITFASMNGDSSYVTLHNSLSSTVYWTMKITGHYYTFRGMTLSALGGSGYGRVMEIANGATNNVIENCVLEGVPVTSTSANFAVVYSNGGKNQYNTLRNNLILYGSYSLYFNGSSSNTQKANVIEGNTITGFYKYGPCLYYQKYLQFNSNYVENTLSNDAYGVRFRYSDQITVTKNHVVINANTSHRGFYIYFCDGSSTNPNLIANNFISIQGASSTTGYGSYAYNSPYTDYINNSINIIGGNSSVSALYTYSGSHINILNNILVNRGSGYAYYVGSSSSILNSDYNNIYTTGGKYAYWQGSKSDLIALRIANTRDSHSKETDPLFVSSTDLHSTSITLNNAGLSVSNIVDDIDGDLRNPFTPDIGADEFIIPNNDAGVLSIDGPTSPVAYGTNNVLVSITNIGADTLSSVIIAWEVNSVLQAPYYWSGSLPNSTSANSVNIGPYNFAANINHIKIWTESPNGQTDGNNTNDTITAVLASCSAPMKGEYTIGGVSPDYNSFNDAVVQLNTCGVDSHVVFTVAPGTYTEQIELNSISGAGSTATVSFESSTLDSTDVIITNNASSSGNYTFQLNGADWIRLKNLTIIATNLTNGRALVLKGGSNNNHFEGNIFIGSNNTTTSCGAIYSGDDNDGFNVFRYNKAKNGYYAIYMEGPSTTTLEDALMFEHNIIEGYFRHAAYFENVDNLVFRYNTIKNGASSTYGKALYLDHADGGMRIYNNKFTIHSASYQYGIGIYDSDATSANPARIYNNFISVVTNSGSSNAIYVGNSSHLDIANNNMYVQTTNPNARTINISSGSNVKILNNSCVIDGPGYAFSVTSSSSITQSDNNNIYSTGANFATYSGVSHLDIASLSGASGKDLNSVTVDPGYTSETDLHVTAITLNANAMVLPYVIDDFDGEIRDVTTPDIGADEFTPIPWDVAAVKILQPNLGYGAPDSLQTVQVLIKNMGSNTLYSLSVAYKYANYPVVTQMWNDTLVSDDTTSVIFTMPFDIDISINELCVYVMLTGDGNNSNDTVCMDYIGIPTINPSHCDDFEGPVIWSSSSDVWEMGSPQGVSIGTPHSGANAWMTTLDGNYPNNAAEYLYSPYYDFTYIVYGATMKFWRNNKFATDDGFAVEYTVDDGSTWILLGVWGDPLGTNWYNGQTGGMHMFMNNTNGWEQSSYDLSQFNQLTTPVQFRFHLNTTGSTTDEGAAIDDFCIEVPTIPNDAGVTSIDSPIDSTQIGSQNNVVTVSVRNFGSASQDTIPVFYQVDSNNPVTDTLIVIGGLEPDSMVQFTFNQHFSSPSVDYLLCAYTALSGDTYVLNDQKCDSLFAGQPLYDAGISKIISPNDTSNSNWVPIEVIVQITNYGTDSFNTCDLQYAINNGTPVVETWNGSMLASGDSVQYTFTTKYTAPAGTYQVCVETNLSNDGDPTNDDTCIYIIPDGIGTSLANGMKLYQNVPNPANENTYIEFEIPSSGIVKFILTNSLGQVEIMKEEDHIPGRHKIIVDANKLASGVYYYTIEFDGYRITKKMMVNR